MAPRMVLRRGENLKYLTDHEVLMQGLEEAFNTAIESTFDPGMPWHMPSFPPQWVHHVCLHEAAKRLSEFGFARGRIDNQELLICDNPSICPSKIHLRAALGKLRANSKMRVARKGRATRRAIWNNSQFSIREPLPTLALELEETSPVLSLFIIYDFTRQYMHVHLAFVVGINASGTTLECEEHRTFISRPLDNAPVMEEKQRPDGDYDFGMFGDKKTGTD